MKSPTAASPQAVNPAQPAPVLLLALHALSHNEQQEGATQINSGLLPTEVLHCKSKQLLQTKQTH